MEVIRYRFDLSRANICNIMAAVMLSELTSVKKSIDVAWRKNWKNWWVNNIWKEEARGLYSIQRTRVYMYHRLGARYTMAQTVLKSDMPFCSCLSWLFCGRKKVYDRR